MNNYKIIKIIDLLLNFFAVAILFFVPLCFAFFLKTNNVFELNKVVLFKILVLILAFLLIIKILIIINQKSLRERSWFLYLNGQKAICWVLGALIISFLFSTFVSENFRQSLYGSYDKQQGLIFFLYLLVYFLVLLYNLSDFGKLKRLMVFIVWSAFIASLYGIVQALGFDPFVWSESTKLRATATFGQPNNFASFIIASLPVVVFLFFNTKALFKKTVFFIIFLAQITSLYFCFSVSAWLGVVIGVAAALSLYLITKLILKTTIDKAGKSKIRYWLVALLFLALALPFFLSQQNPGMFSGRVKNLTNWQTGSTAARLQFWEAAWQGIKTKPLFGHGLETQQEVLMKYYKPEWALFSNVNVRPESAHNIILDILLTRGLFGLLTSLALGCFILNLLWHNIKDRRMVLLNYLLFFYFTAYFVYLNFNFHHISSLIYFIFYFAILLLISKKYFKLEPVEENSGFAGVCITRNKILANMLFLIVGLPFLWWQINIQIKSVANDSYFYELKLSQVNKNYFFALDLYDFLQEDCFHDAYYERQFGLILSDWVSRFNGHFFEMGIEKIKIILPKIDQDTYTDALTRAKLNVLLARQDQKLFETAEADFEKLLKISPGMPLIYREYANMYAAKNDFEKAIEYYQSALSKLPKLEDERMNSEHKKRVAVEMKWNYEGLASVYEKRGDIKKAEEYKTIIKDLAI